MEDLTGFHKDVRDVLSRFIEAYTDLPVLWVVSLKEYSNKKNKNAARDKLVTILKEIKKDTTREDVRKKIDSLRTNYRKGLRKVNDSRSSCVGTDEGNKTFKELSFLSKSESFVSPSVSSANQEAN
jgi:hypothetical protein